MIRHTYYYYYCLKKNEKKCGAWKQKNVQREKIYKMNCENNHDDRFQIECMRDILRFMLVCPVYESVYEIQNKYKRIRKKVVISGAKK